MNNKTDNEQNDQNNINNNKFDYAQTCQNLITPKRVENKAVAVAQLGRSYPQGGDKLNKKRLANKKL